MKRLVKLAIKIGISLLLLAGLARYIDLEAVLERLKNVNFLWVVLASFFLMVGQVLSAIRWTWLARGLGLVVQMSRKIELYFLGMFLSLFLPSIIGGDVARGYLLARGREGAGWAAAASVILERVNGVVAISIIATVCMLGLDLPPQWWIAWMGAVFVLWAGMLTYSFWHRRLPRWMKRWQSLPIDQPVFYHAWWKGLLLSVLFQTLVVEIHVILGHAAGLEISWLAYGVMVCLVALASAIPVSFNGFGVREAGYVGLATYFGGSAEAAAVMAALWVVVLAVAALPGAWVLWRLGGSSAIRREI
ncbi:MAG: lysylphosphatidylglycerol synthase transmembrane domain-containing protein [Zetaproteobacteria bacterium]|nr:MAG: lysylphosphatidylglycerol synthase transmembrane domain-containing protein [Zetaproteobacteria bacterium]